MSERSVDDLEHEVTEEKAAALGRSGRRLQQSLEQFRAHERERAGGEPDARRDRLLWDLAERFESFVVQREACGLRDWRHMLAVYDVPHEAVARIGARRPQEALG